MPSQQALLPLGRQQEPQTLASSSAAWLGELFFERLPWVGDMLAEVQVTDLLSACHPSGVRVTSDLDQQTSWPLHGHHHWRSSGTLSRAGPEAEPQARPEARCAHGGQRRTPCAELLRLVTQLLRVVTPGDRHYGTQGVMRNIGQMRERAETQVLPLSASVSHPVLRLTRSVCTV